MPRKEYKAVWARCVATGILVLSFRTPIVCAAAEPRDKTTPPTEGYTCLFMGHSFFAPIAKSFAEHPARCGFSGHKQTIVAHGGTNGAPGALWNSKEPDVAQARRMLESGTVDLLGLTCYPGAGSGISDYRRWIDLALTNNPKTCILIQAPWSKYENKTLAQYDTESEEILKYVHWLIDQLRQVYPRTTFICIPQGRWMAGLWRLYEKGELPEVSVLKRKTATAREPCLFRDNIGHGGDLPVEMGALLWLAAIYKVDLNTYPWQTNTKFDLKKLAQDIVNHDPYCGLGLKPRTATADDPPAVPAAASISPTHVETRRPVQAGTPSVLGLKPVGYWPCDDGQGAVVRDLSGNNNPGNIHHVPWEKTLLNFTGAYQWIEIPKSRAYQSETFSLGGWVFVRGRIHGGGWPNQAGMLLIGTTDWEQRTGIQLCVRRDEWVDVVQGGQSAFGPPTRDDPARIDGILAIPLGQWQHLVYTYDGRRGRLYINGQLRQERENIPYASVDRNIRIGNDAVWWHQSIKSGALDGSVRDMVWFDRALSAAEVETLCRATKPTAMPAMPAEVVNPAPPEDVPALVRAVHDEARPEEERAHAALALAAMGPRAKEALPVLLQVLCRTGNRPLRVEEVLRNAVLRAVLNVDPGNAQARAALPGPPGGDATFFSERGAGQRDYTATARFNGATYRVGEGVAWKGVEPISAADYQKVLQQNPAAETWRPAHTPTLCRVPITRIDRDGRERKVYLEGETFVIDGADGKVRAWSLFVDKAGYIHVMGGQHNVPDPNAYIPGSWERLGLSRDRKDDRFPMQLYWVSTRPESIESFQFVGRKNSPRAIPAAYLNYMMFVQDHHGDAYLYGRADGNGWQSWGLFRYDVDDCTWTPVGGHASDVIASARKHEPTWIEFLHDNLRGALPAEPGNPVLVWAWQPAFYNFCRDDWGIRFDPTNRMHVLMNILGLDAAGGHRSADVYAYSDDGGRSFHRADGSPVRLPLTCNPAPEHNAEMGANDNGTWFRLWLSLLRDAGYQGIPASRAGVPMPSDAWNKREKRK